ncbi:MAG: sigma-70 family RNA polymerase sigma factor [Acidobacteriota bacterium]
MDSSEVDKAPDPRPPADVTDLLLAWGEGDAAARDRLMGVVHGHLRDQARGQLARERSGHTLQPTALVNEVYLRLVDRRRVQWRNRAHFFGFAAQTMRRILVDHARGKNAQKRGDGVIPVALEDLGDVAAAGGVDLIALDDLLEELARRSPRQARIVELRYFGGLTIGETAEILEISESLVSADWALARSWLYRELRGPS